MKPQANHPGEACEFGVFTELKDFPVTESPAYLREAVGAVCIAGSAVIEVTESRSKITPGVILILFPWHFASLKQVSPDFRITFFRVSQSMFSDTLSSLWMFRSSLYFFMRRRVVTKSDEGYIARFQYFCDLLAYRSEHTPRVWWRETVMQLLRVFYWDVYVGYTNDTSEQHVRYTHKEELAYRFMRMIVEEHSPNKEVAYYADKLKITSKYLTNLVRSISGQSAHDWIVYFTIIEIKALLRESALDLKTIAERVNFPDQPTFSRFFRRYTGMTPSAYRDSIGC